MTPIISNSSIQFLIAPLYVHTQNTYRHKYTTHTHTHTQTTHTHTHTHTSRVPPNLHWPQRLNQSPPGPRPQSPPCRASRPCWGRRGKSRGPQTASCSPHPARHWCCLCTASPPPPGLPAGCWWGGMPWQPPCACQQTQTHHNHRAKADNVKNPDTAGVTKRAASLQVTKRGASLQVTKGSSPAGDQSRKRRS